MLVHPIGNGVTFATNFYPSIFVLPACDGMPFWAKTRPGLTISSRKSPTHDPAGNLWAIGSCIYPHTQV